MSHPYRNNDKPIEIPPTLMERIHLWWERSRDGITTTMGWIFAAIAIAGITCLIAMLAQWVVTGFAGHPIGAFWHYVGAVILYSILRYRSSSKDDNSHK